MSVFTPIEQTAIAAILDEAVEHRAGVEQQLNRSRVLSRENTGGGFFTALEVSTSADRLAYDVEPLGQNVYIGVCGLDYGLGIILHLKDGYVNLLEGYSVGGEDTSATDFAYVRSALIGRPGRIPTNVRSPPLADIRHGRAANVRYRPIADIRGGDTLRHNICISTR